jgi:hypothetical protein
VLLQTPGPVFDPGRLASAFAQVPASAWAVPHGPEDPVAAGYHFASLVQGGRRKVVADLFEFVLREFAPVWTAWLAKVPAHGFIGPHIDQGPYHERWHVPIHPAGTFDGREVEAGVSFPVAHWAPHQVDNPTDRDRIHLVVDRDVWVDVPTAPYQRIERAHEDQDEGPADGHSGRGLVAVAGRDGGPA